MDKIYISESQNLVTIQDYGVFYFVENGTCCKCAFLNTNYCLMPCLPFQRKDNKNGHFRRT